MENTAYFFYVVYFLWVGLCFFIFIKRYILSFKKHKHEFAAVIISLALSGLLIESISQNNTMGTGDTYNQKIASPQARQEPGEPTLDTFNFVDDALKQLRDAEILFNVPEKMDTGDTAIIQLVLKTDPFQQDYSRYIKHKGKITKEEIKISPSMKAILSGENFSIKNISEEIQAVTKNDTTGWQWSIKPLESGPQSLHLTITAYVYIKNEKIPRGIKTFDREIIVKINPIAFTKDFIEKNLWGIITIILLPIVIVIYNKIFKTRNPQKKGPNKQDW